MPNTIVLKKLFDALDAGNNLDAKECIATLKNSPKDFEAQNEQGLTPLTVAAGLGNAVCVKALIEAGAKIDQGDVNGDTALHWAALRKHSDCVSLLIDYEADVNKKNQDDGDIPLHDAVAGGDLQCVRALVAAGAKLETENNLQRTPLDEALFKSNKAYSIIIFLIINRAEIREIDALKAFLTSQYLDPDLYLKRILMVRDLHAENIFLATDEATQWRLPEVMVRDLARINEPTNILPNRHLSFYNPNQLFRILQEEQKIARRFASPSQRFQQEARKSLLKSYTFRPKKKENNTSSLRPRSGKKFRPCGY